MMAIANYFYFIWYLEGEGRLHVLIARLVNFSTVFHCRGFNYMWRCSFFLQLLTWWGRKKARLWNLGNLTLKWGLGLRVVGNSKNWKKFKKIWGKSKEISKISTEIFKTWDLLKPTSKKLLRKTFKPTIVMRHFIATLSKKSLKHRCISVDFTKCLRTCFL